MTKLIKIFYFLGFGMIIFCLISCEKKQEVKQAEPPAKVVSKTIAMQPSSGKKGPDTPESVPKAVVPQTNAGDGKNTASPVGEELVKREKALAEAAEAAETAVDMVANQVKKYDPKDRVDPFIPLLTEKQEIAEESGENKPKRMLTPLEKMDLSQIKLVAVVQMTGGALAMVEEANGKGYEVHLGTYMGQNGGQVSAIHAESIVVKEYFKDFKGKRQERFQEIKFHNNEGGE
jgi:type IV pilus assembly protein PilP